MDDFEKELREGFLEEASQLLTDAEQCFLALETAADDPSIIEKIFRLAHNFKGSANAVGFSDVGAFAHKFESLLLKVKNKELPVTTEIVNLLLRCNDHLTVSIATLREDLTARIDAPELAQELIDYIEGKKKVEVQDESAPSPEEVAALAATSAEADVSDIPVSAEPMTEVALPVEPTAQVTAEILQSAPPVQTDPIEQVVPAPEAPAPETPAVEAKPPTPKASATPSAAASDESIRVNLSKVDALINNVGEIVILQTVLNQQRMLIPNPLVQKTISQLAKITKDLQEVSMSLRMIPFKQTFSKMQRIVRDCAKALNKDIELIVAGEETEIDKTILELLGDPLVHLIRNAVDHGVESTEERIAAGKSGKGTVWLNAYHRGEHIVVEVRDDGKGLDPQKLIKKAIEKKILSPTAKLSDSEAHQLIFAPGFSTKEQVTDVSGRGVGMDVVKTNIEKLKGEILIETNLGKGTTFKILLPLTLAIIDGVVVMAESDRFVVPLSNVYESVQPSESDVHLMTGVGEVFCLRGENLPLLRLGTLMGRKSATGRKAWESLALVVRDGDKPYAIIVDDIVGQQQVVIKKLGPELKKVPGLAGGAILGDGKAALIIDLHGLAASSSKTVQRGMS